MIISNITPGLIPIPPNGWGAVEKIIWETHLSLQKLGHTSRIPYLNDLQGDEDIVHIHVANLALMAHEQNIPYYFTMHDHHTFLYGKESDLYKENLEAMKHSIKSFVPAKYLVEYFENIPEYFSHGVSDSFTPPPYVEKTNPSLLCVANNGYAFDQSVDRKGFKLAIETAKVLGYRITIAGPKNNERFFNRNPELLEYINLTVLYDLTETDLIKLYKEHDIFIHLSDLEAGHPNLTLLEAMASGLPVVGTFEDDSLKGLLRVEKNRDSVINGILTVMRDYEKYRDEAIQQSLDLSWDNRVKELIKIYKSKEDMKDVLIRSYETTKKLLKDIRTNIVSFDYNFIDGAYMEVKSPIEKTCEVSFRDLKNNEIVHRSTIKNNMWTRTSRQYFTDWEIEVKIGNETNKFRLDLKNKIVLISFESKSIGDTIAWLPYVEEFRIKHDCYVVCSTFHNYLFEEEYKTIKFVKPGSTVNNIKALYRIGAFYGDSNCSPIDANKTPLQKIATDILGLEFSEIKPRIRKHPLFKKDIVTIGFHSTAQCKYWNNKEGWQEVVDYLNERGYEVVLVSSEENGYMGNVDPSGVTKFPSSSLSTVHRKIQESKMFIGISSGLSWLAWASDVPTVLISGFTDEFVEPSNGIYRVINKDVCHGCWSTDKFNPGDWNYCPRFKDTPQMFECSKEITGSMVIDKIKEIL